MRSISARTPRLWLAPVVRMNMSYEIDKLAPTSPRSAPRCSSTNCLRRHAALGGGLRDLLPVLVEAREKLHVVAAHATIPRDDVGADLLVRVTDVRIAVRVVDGGRQIELVPLSCLRSVLAAPSDDPSRGPRPPGRFRRPPRRPRRRCGRRSLALGRIGVCVASASLRLRSTLGR